MEKQLTLKTNDKGESGFELDEIQKSIGAELFSAFSRWLADKTLIEVDGKKCVLVAHWELYKELRKKVLPKL